MVGRIPYDEFSFFQENAEEFGIEFTEAPLVRREQVEVAPSCRLSALVWGDGPPEFVLLHGGAQNAHTWDTVALALGCPLVAIDLAGHGHSDPAPSGSALDLDDRTPEIATAVQSLAPNARAVVGMSLGGLTALALYANCPDLVSRIVLVDVTPGVTPEKSSAISAFIDGPAGFDSFDDILNRTIKHNPTRTVNSLRRGVLHNAAQLEDGTWVWRYSRARGLERDPGSFPDFVPLWDVVSTIQKPLMLARGMRDQSVVDDADEAELLRRCPSARVEHFAEAGHSIQGDSPVELARALSDFASL